MRLKRHETFRSLSAAVGVAVAVAGGFGAAVGTYSPPDPQTAGVDAHAGGAYAPGSQVAEAVSTQDNGDGTFTVLRVTAVRGSAVGANASASGGGTPVAGQGAEVGRTRFSLLQSVCDENGECLPQQEMAGEVPGSAFQFDPLMQSATFSYEFDGCQIDVGWTGEGLIGPVEGHASSTRVAPWHAEVRADARAEMSRVAPADIDACFLGAPIQNAPGYLSQGALSHDGHVHVVEDAWWD